MIILLHGQTHHGYVIAWIKPWGLCSVKFYTIHELSNMPHMETANSRARFRFPLPACLCWGFFYAGNRELYDVLSPGFIEFDQFSDISASPKLIHWSTYSTPLFHECWPPFVIPHGLILKPCENGRFFFSFSWDFVLLLLNCRYDAWIATTNPSVFMSKWRQILFLWLW